MPTEDLTPWLNKVKQAGSRSEVLSLLDEFRKLEWTDAQCSSMSKLYIRIIERLGDDSGAAVKSAEVVEDHDGPVWYEKM